jgi:hypothetical protein
MTQEELSTDLGIEEFRPPTALSQFGSPDLNDATARRERRIIEVVKRRQDRIMNLYPDHVLNRPIGSDGSPEIEDQLNEWANLVNPENLVTLQARFMERAQTIGPDKAAHELVMRDREMQDAALRLSGE